MEQVKKGMMSVDQSNVWEYNCPQFVDFQECEDNNLDSYFETDHENGIQITVSPGMQTGGIQKKFNLIQPELAVKQGLKTVKTDDLCTRFKKQNYASGKAMNAEKQKDYTLRLTPFRETRAKSYCCAYQNRDNEVLGSEIMLSGTNSKPYDLRVTPARKGHTKSCFTFHKQDLESNKHDIQRCYNGLHSENKEKGNNAMALSRLCSTELKTNVKNSMKASTSIIKGKEANILKRSTSSPGASDFPIKRPRFTFHSKIQNVRKPVKSGNNHKLPENARKNILLNSRQKTVVTKKTFAENLPRTSVAPSSKCTVIKPFHFETDARIKDHKSKEEYKKLDFFSSLRTNSLKQSKLICRTTKPEPFNFSQVKRRKRNSDKICEDMHNESSKSNKSRNLVQPHSPNLLAVKRNRRVSYVGQEIKDDLEALAIKKWKFHAKPVNPSIFTQPSLPKVQNKRPTKPERKSLATEKKFQNKEDKSQSDNEEKYEFHAQPFPKKIFLTPGVSGIQRGSKLEPTEAKSPTFALKTRSQRWKEYADTLKEKNKKEEKHFKARSIPDFHAPASLNIEKKYTVLEPFSFDEKDKLRQSKKEQKIHEVIEKEKQVAKFKANPLPSTSCGPTSFHKTAKRPATKPVPFNFQITQMGFEAAAKWQKEIETQLELQKKASVFKAQPSTIVKKPPFLPDKSLKPLTVCNTFQLNTERRASQWVKFEECVKAKQAVIETKLLLLQAEKEQKEKEEIAQLRKESVHHANPVRHYKVFDLKPSEKPVTTPVSPNFVTRLRSRERV